jgi:hypothetical protein
MTLIDASLARMPHASWGGASPFLGMPALDRVREPATA